MQQPVNLLKYAEKTVMGQAIVMNTANHRCPAAACLGQRDRPLLGHLPLPVAGKIHRLYPAIRLCHRNRANVAFISPDEEHRKAVIQQGKFRPDLPVQNPTDKDYGSPLHSQGSCRPNGSMRTIRAAI